MLLPLAKFIALFVCMLYVYSFVALASGEKSKEAVVRLNLKEAKVFAVRNNYKILALRRRIESLSHEISESRASFFPRLDIVGGMSSDFEEEEAKTAPVGYLSGSYNLFNGGRDSWRTRLSKAEHRLARIELAREEQEIELQVERYFFEHIFVSRMIAHKNKALEYNQKHKRLVRRKREAGLVSGADAMEFELRDALIQSEYVRRKLDLEESRIHLKKILGPEIGAKMRPVGDLPQLSVAHDLMHYVNLIKSGNHDVQHAAHRVDLANTKKAIADAAWLPSIDLEAQYGFLPLDERIERDADTTTTRILLSASFNLFSGYRDRYRRLSAGASLKSDENDLKDQIVQTVADVERQYRKLKAYETRLDLEKNNIVRTDKYYTAVVREYNRGTKNSSDLAMAIDQYLQAIENRDHLKFEFLKTKIELERLIGQGLKVVVIPEVTP